MDPVIKEAAKIVLVKLNNIRMAEFLQNEGIYDRQRLPTNAVLAVIAALYADIPESGDKRGKDELLLKKYLWYSFSQTVMKTLLQLMLMQILLYFAK